MNNIRTVILFAAMSASLWSCGTGIVRHDDDPTPSVEKLEIRASTTVIEADGTDAVQLEVLADGVPVTEGVRLYDGATNLAIELPSMTFTTTEPGTYYFWAAYGTAHTEQLKVTAVGFDLPSLPEDPEPDNTSFVRRVLLTQFTGTGCGFCPGMIEILRSVLADEDYASRVVHTAAHTYNNTDPAYLSQPLNQAMGVSDYPTVVADMAYSYRNYLDEGGLRDMLDQAYDASAANAGISAATAFADGQLVVMASVKAAVTAEYCISEHGCWKTAFMAGRRIIIAPELGPGITTRTTTASAMPTAGCPMWITAVFPSVPWRRDARLNMYSRLVSRTTGFRTTAMSPSLSPNAGTGAGRSTT